MTAVRAYGHTGQLGKMEQNGHVKNVVLSTGFRLTEDSDVLFVTLKYLERSRSTF